MLANFSAQILVPLRLSNWVLDSGNICCREKASTPRSEERARSGERDEWPSFFTPLVSITHSTCHPGAFVEAIGVAFSASDPSSILWLRSDVQVVVPVVLGPLNGCLQSETLFGDLV